MINCNGGRIGRLWWENSSYGGVFPRYGQPRTWFLPGHWGWDHAWPDNHAWPISPWGKGDPEDENYRDNVAFEAWLDDQIDLDLNITERIDLYAMFCGVFKAGIAAGRDPWHWANELQRQAEQPPRQFGIVADMEAQFD